MTRVSARAAGNKFMALARRAAHEAESRASDGPFTIYIPSLPPSVNRLYINRKGGKGAKCLSPEARLWRERAGWELALAHPPKGLKRPSLTLHFGFKGCRRTDADNRVKQVLDLLVRHGVFQDDSDKHLPGFAVSSDRSFTGVRIAITPAAESEAA